jgi:hypothetical protein
MATGEHIRSLLAEIGPEVKRDWTLFVNGKVVEEVREAELVHEKFGVWRYGRSSAGPFDTWSFEEVGGGGSVLVPFVKMDAQLYVGLVIQKRQNQSETPVLNVPRGFLDPKENHFEAAVREMGEEMARVDEKQVFPLTGEPGNPNSTFFITRGAGMGVHFYGVRFRPELLKEESPGVFVFKPGAVKPLNMDSKVAEQILGSKFIRWQSAAQHGDLFTRSAVASLLATE